MKGIFVGDQAPWCGGLLRFKVLLDAYGEKAKITYFLQDADLPWRKEGISRPQLKQRWPNYWSLAMRHCWSPETPTHCLSSMRDSLGAPRGLTYLAGGNTRTSIWGHRESSPLPELLSLLWEKEGAWLQKLGTIAGITPYVPEVPYGGVLQAAECCAEYAVDGKSSSISSVVELFRESPPKTLEVLPPEYFWSITRNGERYPYHHGEHGHLALVPKGAALLVEFALRGMAIGCTGLPYLREVQQLRDKYVPGLPVHILKVAFSWEPAVDVFDALLAEFHKRKEKRGQSVALSEETVEDIREYWRGRPTSFAYMAFGGELNPRIEHIVL